MLEETATRWPLPYYWAHEYLPFFSKAYRPYRIGVVALTSLAAIGAIGGKSVRPKPLQGLPRGRALSGCSGLHAAAHGPLSNSGPWSKPQACLTEATALHAWPEEASLRPAVGGLLCRITFLGAFQRFVCKRG